MKLFNFFKTNSQDNSMKCEKLVEEIRLQRVLINAFNNRLNQHTNHDLIESEIFELRAAEVKYSYLLKQYKALSGFEVQAQELTEKTKEKVKEKIAEKRKGKKETVSLT